MPLYRDVKPGDILRIGDIEIVAERKSGQVTRLRIHTSLPIRQTRGGSPPPATPEPSAPAAAPTEPVLRRPKTPA